MSDKTDRGPIREDVEIYFNFFRAMIVVSDINALPLKKREMLKSHIKLCILMCGGDDVMATNLAIDDRLIEMARTIGKHSTKKAAVTEALKEYIRKRRQLAITKLFGKIGYEKDYDYKKQRKRA